MKDVWKFLKSPRGLALVLWYGLLAFLVLFYIQQVFDGFGVLSLQGAQAVVGLVLMIVFFMLLHVVMWPAQPRPPDQAFASPPSSLSEGHAFPSRITIIVGIWLMMFSAASIVGFFIAYNAPEWLKDVFDPLASGADATARTTRDTEFEPIKEALLTLFAAGLGSSITTILGYLRHASEDKDFSLAYAPWYVARPIMGLILGLIFYFVLKGGLLATIGTENDTLEVVQDLNDWTVSAFGALVGLFSKNAIEKLRELFNTFFKVEEEKKQEDAVGSPPMSPP